MSDTPFVPFSSTDTTESLAYVLLLIHFKEDLLLLLVSSISCSSRSLFRPFGYAFTFNLPEFIVLSIFFILIWSQVFEEYFLLCHNLLNPFLIGNMHLLFWFFFFNMVSLNNFHTIISILSVKIYFS